MGNTLILYGTANKEASVQSLGIAMDLPSSEIDKVVLISNETDELIVQILKTYFAKSCCGGPEVVTTELPDRTIYEKSINGKNTKFLHIVGNSNIFSEAIKFAAKEKQPVIIAEIGYLFTSDTTKNLVDAFKDKYIGATYCTEIVNKRIQYQPSFSPSIKYQFPLGHIAVKPELINGDEKSIFEIVINAFKKSVTLKIPGIYVFK